MSATDQERIAAILNGNFRMIRHILRHGHDGKMIQEARNILGLQGSDEEVVQAVLSHQGKFEIKDYMDFPAVCVDWEGTLFNNGAIDTAVLRQAQETSTQRGLSVVVWTGGDVKQVYVELARQGIEDVNICRKQDCAGLKARVAIDDETLDALKNAYGLDVSEFEQK